MRETLSKDEIVGLYRRRARCYSISANLYYLLGFREHAYRRQAVRALHLRPGDTVVEIGCGTGLNFRLIQREVGPAGRIIGVDLTDAMLVQARRRTARHGWSNVELVQADAARYEWPAGINAALSTFAIPLVPEYDAVIRAGARALSPGGRLVILDLKEPDRLPRWLVRLAVWLASPFAVTADLAHRHPWESVQRYLTHAEFVELYWGFAYIAAGEAPGDGRGAKEYGESRR